MRKFIKIFLPFLLVLSSCFNEAEENVAIEESFTYEDYLAIRENSIISSIHQKYIGRLNDGSSPNFKINTSKYLVAIEVKRKEDLFGLPNGLYFKGLELKDNGKGFDEIPNDGIYTSTDYLEVIEEKPNNLKLNVWRSILNRSSPNASCIGCDSIDFAGPEEDCLEEGTSLEFHWWNNWFCVCGTDCFACLGDSCECE